MLGDAGGAWLIAQRQLAALAAKKELLSTDQLNAEFQSTEAGIRHGGLYAVSACAV